MKSPVDHTSLESQKEYFEYAQTISLKGRLYRKYIVYPRVVKLLEGLTLDIGCCIGAFMSFRANTIGIDINPHCVKHCIEKGFEAYHYDSYPTHFDEGKFDSIFLDYVLEHIEDPSELITEMHRLLKVGGKAVIGVPTFAGFYCEADHKVFYDEEKLANTFKKFGFRLNKLIYTPFKSKYLEKRMNAHELFAQFVKE